MVTRDASWPRVIAAFLLLFAIYQAAEGLNAVFTPGSPIGPALMLAVVVVAWPVGRWLGWRGYDAYGLDLNPRSFACLAGGVLLAALAKLSALMVGLVTGAYVASEAADGATMSANAVLLTLATAALFTFVPSIAEDIITRGFLLRTKPITRHFAVFAVLSAGLYTLNHTWRFDWGLSEQFRLFCFGLAYAAGAWRWRSLWGAVALHWGWNLWGMLSDTFLPLAVDVVQGRFLSAGAHLVILAVVLLLPTVPRRSEADS